MRNILNSISNRLSAWMEVVAGIALVGVMLLIGCDILGRIFGYPVPGAYEIVSLAGGLIIGLALPATSLANGHVSTDLLLTKLSETPRRILTAFARFIGIAIFLFAGWGTVLMAARLKHSGEVTAVLALPLYYAAYAVGGAFFTQALVSLSQLFKVMNPKSQR